MNIQSLNFTQLARFLALAEELHFTRTAEKLNIAQPLLSEQIKGLENAIGAKLFVRTSRRVELTAAGMVFRDRAQLIVQGMRDAIDATHMAVRGKGLRLRIGHTDEYSGDLLPDCMRALKQADASHELVVTMAMAQDLVEMLKMSVVDVALVCPIPETLPGDDFHVLTLPGRPLSVALPRHHALAKRKRISPLDLADEAFIEGPLDPQAASESVVNRLFSDLGVKRTIVQRISDVELGLNLVAGGLGVFIGSFSRHVSARDDVAFVRLQADGAELTRAAIWSKQAPSPLTADFIERVNDLASGRATIAPAP
jgi:DNA-binding transcriptional LysR family regulator